MKYLLFLLANKKIQKIKSEDLNKKKYLKKHENGNYSGFIFELLAVCSCFF
jgi:hypothetical protein